MAEGFGVKSVGPRVLFLGMSGGFSVPPLEALLRAGLPVCAVLLPGGSPTAGLVELRPGLRVLSNPRTIIQVAWEHGIPAVESSALAAPETLAAVGNLHPDVIAVACFDRLAPRAFRERARLAVNVHPSLLPENRGPAPLFWTFRLGLKRTGVTVHLLEERADAGAILAQRELRVPEGINGPQLDQQLAEVGGELLVQVIRAFEAGRLRPQPQDEARATTYSWPAGDDWVIPLEWSQERASNFIRGVSHLGGPIRKAQT